MIESILVFILHKADYIFSKNPKTKIMRSRLGAIANPQAQVFDPQHPKSHFWGMTQVTEWKF